MTGRYAIQIVAFFVLHLIALQTYALQDDCTTPACKQFDHLRAELIREENALRFDAQASALSPQEKTVEKLLINLKLNEAVETGTEFPPTINFRAAKPRIEQSPVFKILKRMPKGGILHIHSIIDAQYVYNLGAYDPDCYLNTGNNSVGPIPGSFLFSRTQPPSENGAVWVNVVQLRKQSANATLFDEELFKTMQFYTPSNMSEDDMWVYFNQAIQRLGSLCGYLPHYKATFMNGLKSLHDDGVIHVEQRGIPPAVDANQKEIPFLDMLHYYQQWLAEFNRDHNASMTSRIIYAQDRAANVSTVKQGLHEALQLVNKYPDMVIGYDLDDQEDRFNTLQFYLQDFLDIKQYALENKLTPLRYYFHAGETAWDIGKAENNLYDAILLNTTRIGHGYALKNHPVLMQIARARQLAIEVCPISNQMLMLLSDLRNHPANIFAAYGVTFTLSPDDPSIYGYTGVSYDFYEAFMAWDLDLRGLKQLVFNSINYSALSSTAKRLQTLHLISMWNRWIEETSKQV